MATNAIAISRDLENAGFNKKQADAIAESVVTHSDETHATKTDFAKLEARLTVLQHTVIGFGVAILATQLAPYITGG